LLNYVSAGNIHKSGCHKCQFFFSAQTSTYLQVSGSW